MANNIADLVISLTAETASMSRGLDKATGEFQKFSSNIENQLSVVATGLAALGEAMVAAFTVDALVRFTERIIDTGDKINKLSQIAGVSVESFSEMAYAAKLADIDNQTLATGMGKLSRSMVDAANGSEKAKAAFAALGINIRDSQGSIRNVSDVMRDMAGRFANAPDGVAKTAIAMELLGRSGAELIPFFNQGAAGFDALKQESHDLNAVWSSESARAAEEFHDNITRLQTAVEGLGKSLLVDLIPYMNKFTEQMVAASKNQSSSVWAETLGLALKGVVAVLDTAVTGLGEAVLRARELATALRFLVDLDWNQFKQGIVQTETEIGKLNLRSVDRIQSLFGAGTVNALDAMKAAGGAKATYDLPVPKVQKDISRELERAQDFFRQLQPKLAKADDDVIGEINAKWDAEYAKVEEFKKKYPQLIGEALDAEYKIRLAKRHEIDAAEQKLLIDANKAAAELSKGLLEGTLLTVPTNVGQHSAPSLMFNPLQAQLDALSGVNAKDAESIMQAAKARGEIIDQAFESTRTHAEQLAFQIQKLNIAFGDDRESDTYKRALQQVKDQFDVNTMALNQFAQEAGQAFQQAIFHTHDFKSALESLLESLALLIPKLLLMKEIESLTAKGAGFGSNLLGGVLGGILGVGHASGGPVTAGVGYIVGENGPEPFVPATDGYVMPNSALQSMGSGMNVTYAIDARGADAGVEARVMRAIRASHDSAVQTSMARIYDRQKRR